MTYAVGTFTGEHDAYVGTALRVALPDIVTAATGAPIAVQELTGPSPDPNTWNITISGGANGMTLYQSAANQSTGGFLSVTNGRLSSVELRWTPSAGQAYTLADGRQVRPRGWSVEFQVSGGGDWAGREFGFAMSLTAIDRIVHAEELSDDASITEYGQLGREAGAPWYHPDHLNLAIKRKYARPPLAVRIRFVGVQDTREELSELFGLQPGTLVTVRSRARGNRGTITGVVVASRLEFSSRGLPYKTVTVLERVITSVPIEINGVPVTINDVPLQIGE